MALVIVREDGGGDYTTLAAAISASETEIEIQGTWTSAETSQYTISAATTITATGSSKTPPNLESSPTHWRNRSATSGQHVISTSANLDITGLDLQNVSTGTSDEVIRLLANNITLGAVDCLLGFNTANSQQDIVYNNANSGCTVNLTNCICYRAGRSGVGIFFGANILDFSVNINSCSFYDVGSFNEARAGIIGSDRCDGTFNVFNSLLHVSGFNSTSDKVFYVGPNGVPTINCDRSITNEDTISNSTETDTLLNANWTDDNSKASDNDWVIVTDLTASTLDLSLQSNTFNEAQDAHSDASGAGLTMPSTDIAGTTRSAPYCIGAFRVVSAGATLVIQSITQAQTIDNLDLIQQSTLTIGDILQSQTIENIDLLQQSTLSINDIGQAQAIDNIDLSIAVLLSINSLTQEQAIENIELIQQSTLVINGVGQAQTLDNVELSTAILLSIGKLSQSQEIDNLDLVQQSTLSINDMSQDQNIDNVTLSAAVILEIADIIQAQNLESVNLVPLYTLSIDPVTQEQTVDNVTLDAELVLAIADIIQSQLIGNIDLTQQSTLSISDILQTQELSDITLIISQIDGKITISFVGKKPTISFSGKGPSATMTRI